MSITLVTTWGGETSNSYNDLSSVSVYIEENFIDDEVWIDLTEEQRRKIILRSTRDIDNTLLYSGRRREAKQRLQFPRVFDIEIFPFIHTDPSVQDDDIIERDMKRRVQDALAEQCYFIAKAFSQGIGDEHRERQALGITSISESIGPISESVSYAGGGGSSMKLSPNAYDLIKHYVASPRLVRGGAFEHGIR
jgi:hypothetical protein